MSNLNDTPANGQLAIPTLKEPDFLINTSPEMDALERAAADGAHGRHYTDNPQAGTRTYNPPGSKHSVQLSISEEERWAGMQISALTEMTERQDADSAIAFLYISRLLVPPSPLLPNTTAAGKVDFDDVIAKIGWNPRSTTERREMHKRLYDFIRFGERAQVMGTRRGYYTDKHTGEVIKTEIKTALWRIMGTEKPEEGSAYAISEVPVSVVLAVSPDWAVLLRSAKTAQYLPMGEILGAIPGSRASGAWARVIGLALASFWRRNPRECIDGSIKITRRELLDRYTPKTGPVDKLLDSKDPKLALVYWCGAMDILSNCGFIEKKGEAVVTLEELRNKYPRKGWADMWLNEFVYIAPGPLMYGSLTDRVKAIDSAPVPIRKRGRPRKVQA